MYLPFLAALAFVGCSNDDAPVDNGGGAGTNYGYVAVNIVSSAGTRADADGFVDGTSEESQANQGLFFIFTEDGNSMFGDAQRLDFTGSEDGTGNVDKIYSTLLVVDGEDADPTEGGTKKYQIVCVLNAPAELEKDVKTLAQLTAKIADYSDRTNGFIMTNSVYKNGDAAVVGAEVTQVYKSATEAYAAPVSIYVERVVAKIKASKHADVTFQNKNATVSIDGTEKTLTIKPTGIALVSLADKAYLFKNIEGIDYTWTWNDAANFRSYWEVVPSIVAAGDTDLADNMVYTEKDKNYNEIVTESKPETGDFDIEAAKIEEYVLPNTAAVSTERPTALVVTAELYDGANRMNNLAYIRGGYTTSDKALEVVGKHLATSKGWWMKDASDAVVPFDQNGLEWKNGMDLGAAVPDLKRYEVVAQVKEGVTVYDAAGNAVDNGATEANDYLKSDGAKGYQARVFTEGKCYYWVYIVRHTEGTGETKVEFPGVVRNHVYDLSLETIEGVGTPVFDATDDIIPEDVKSETTFYLGAKVNVLGWRVVATQHVNF